MTPTQKKILNALQGGKTLSPKQITQCTGIKHPRKTIRTLEQKGLIESKGIYNNTKYKLKENE